MRSADSTIAPCPARPGPGCRPVDDGFCRIAINDLRAEIDHLRNGIDVVEIKEAFAPFAPPFDETPLPLPVPPAPPAPSARPMYAVTPIGVIRPAADQSTTSLPPIVIENWPYVTNLGTLLDVLA